MRHDREMNLAFLLMFQPMNEPAATEFDVIRMGSNSQDGLTVQERLHERFSPSDGLPESMFNANTEGYFLLNIAIMELCDMGNAVQSECA
jgi:hypothetical protein